MGFILKNDAEMGSDTTAVTTGNSGSTGNNAWDNVSTVSGGTITFSSIQKSRGTLSYQFDSGLSPGSAFLEWNVINYVLFCRFYVYFPTSVQNNTLVSCADSLDAGRGSLETSSGKFIMKRAGGSVSLTSTNNAPADQWIRIEAMFRTSTTVGQLQMRIYHNADSMTPTETLTSGNINNGSTPHANITFGINANLGNIVYMDDMAIGLTGYPDPPYDTTASWMRFN